MKHWLRKRCVARAGGNKRGWAPQTTRGNPGRSRKSAYNEAELKTLYEVTEKTYARKLRNRNVYN